MEALPIARPFPIEKPSGLWAMCFFSFPSERVQSSGNWRGYLLKGVEFLQSLLGWRKKTLKKGEKQNQFSREIEFVLQRKKKKYLKNTFLKQVFVLCFSYKKKMIFFPPYYHIRSYLYSCKALIYKLMIYKSKYT